MLHDSIMGARNDKHARKLQHEDRQLLETNDRLAHRKEPGARCDNSCYYDIVVKVFKGELQPIDLRTRLSLELNR